MWILLVRFVHTRRQPSPQKPRSRTRRPVIVMGNAQCKHEITLTLTFFGGEDQVRFVDSSFFLQGIWNRCSSLDVTILPARSCLSAPPRPAGPRCRAGGAPQSSLGRRPTASPHREDGAPGKRWRRVVPVARSHTSHQRPGVCDATRRQHALESRERGHGLRRR
jgi:hypothetical protein